MEKGADMTRILVVDDDAVIREGLKHVFSGGCYRVEAHAAGRPALESLQAQEFDLVITDLRMAGMDGMELLRSIRILQPDVPVIVITGCSTIDSAVEAMKNGAADYVAKPFTPELIREKVAKATEQREAFVRETCLRKGLHDHRGGGEEPRLHPGAHVPKSAEELKEAKRQLREQAVASVEKAFVLSALERNNWNITRAAEETGMLRPNFQAMLKRLGISARGFTEH
jgi:DNA-binding NtrC family response regulator